jgi:glycosyltransferase involved in cell wall biosynthesis
MNQVLFLTQGADNNLPSRRLRIMSILPYLKSFDFLIDVAPVNLLKVVLILPKVFKSKLIFIQKELTPLSFLLLLKILQKPIIFDFDDAIYLRHLSSGDFRKSNKRNRRFSLVCKFANLVIAGNEILAKAALFRRAKFVQVIPTSLELQGIKNIFDKPGKKVILGWIGTGVNLIYLEDWETVLSKLNSKGFNFELRVMSNKQPNFKKFNQFKFFEWSEIAEKNFLKNIDIGLMPLFNNEYTEGKCAFKALQYLSYSKPVVASDVGINRLWLEKASYISNDKEVILRSLEELIQDRKKRLFLGKEGYRIIKKNFERKMIACKIEKAINSILLL